MKILGIDPGTARTGYGLIEGSGTSWKMVDCGLLETTPDESPAARLDRLGTLLRNLLAEATPDAVAVEKLFFAKNVTTGMAVAEARGVIMVTLQQSGLEPAEYTGLQVKQSVTGYGQAPKQQVATMVCRLLGLAKAPKPDDVTDALAIALCHAGWAKLTPSR